MQQSVDYIETAKQDTKKAVKYQSQARRVRPFSFREFHNFFACLLFCFAESDSSGSAGRSRLARGCLDYFFYGQVQVIGVLICALISVVFLFDAFLVLVCFASRSHLLTACFGRDAVFNDLEN